MKRVMFLLLLVSSTIIWTPAVQAVPPGCTEVGTPERDVIAGTSGRDKICTLGGGDYAHGGGGNDAVLGGGAADTLIGGDGKDRIRGNGGADRLFSVDQNPGDIVKGGRGRDSCFGDKGDAFRSCERTFRTGTSAAVEATLAALSDVLFEMIVLGEELQAQVDELIRIIETIGVPGPPGPPGTPGPPGPAVFPPCNPPPSSSPPICEV